MYGLIKQITTKYFSSYMEFFIKISNFNILYRILIIPVFTFIYILTFFALSLIVLTVVLFVMPISLIYKPHLKNSYKK